MAKVQVTLSVDDEVKGVADALVAVVKDIKSKAAVGQYVSDLIAAITPALSDIQNLSADLKADADNIKYLAAALAGVAEIFLLPTAA